MVRWVWVWVVGRIMRGWVWVKPHTPACLHPWLAACICLYTYICVFNGGLFVGLKGGGGVGWYGRLKPHTLTACLHVCVYIYICICMDG